MNEKSINIAKAFGILAVLIDHLKGILYTRDDIQLSTFYSVSLFIVVMGITTYWSFDGGKINQIFHKVYKRIVKIVFPYSVSVFLYCLLNRQITFERYFSSWVHFNASSPHYFVFLYLQMLIVAPIVFGIVKKLGGLGIQLIFFCVWAFISEKYCPVGFTTGYWGGGTYIICLYLGMIIGKHYHRIWELISTGKKRFIISCVITYVCLLYLIFMVKLGFFFDYYNFFNSKINPPGFTLIIYSVFILFFILFWVKTMESYGIDSMYCVNILNYLGMHTLYIFLYHRLILDFFLCKYFRLFMDSGINNNLTAIGIVLFLFSMILGCIVIEKLGKEFVFKKINFVRK